MKKKQYEKPKVTKVNLIPDEMMLSGCKQISGAGGKNNKCYPLGNGCKNNSGS